MDGNSDDNLWPWTTGAADWARRRKKDKVARRDRSNGGSAIVDPLTGAVAAKHGHGPGNKGGQENKHHDAQAPSGGNRQRKSKAAASKFDKLIETRQELQNSMQRVTTTAAQWDRVAAELDAKALSIGQEDAVTAAIQAALGESEESRRAETAMLVDLEGWLARVASLPGELMEMEIDNTLAERMDGMANATLGFEEDTAKYGKQLSLTMAKFNALTEAERKDAKALRKDAQSNRERVEKLTSVANELGTIAQRLEKDLDAAQDKYKELLKAHKQSVATAQADRERVAEDHALALMARDKLLGAAEEKLRSQEHLGRALIGDSDLAEKLDTLERNAATSHLQILDLNRLIGEKDAQIKKQQEIIKKLQDDLEKALTSPSEVPKLKTRIFELQGEVKELKDTVTELGGSEDHLKLEIQELTQQVVQLKEGMRDLVGEKDKLAQEAHSAKLKLKELVDEVKKARAAEKEATKIAQEAEGRIQAAEDDAKKWQQRAEAAEQRARDADQALQVKIDAATASLRKELADARTEAATATARANEEAAKVPPLESEIEALKARPMGDPGLAAELAALKASSEELSASLRQRIADLEQELADTQRALDAGGRSSDPALELALAEEREKAEAMANEISRLTKLNEMAQAKIDAAHIAAQDQATAIGELTSKIGELQTLLEAAMSTVKGLPERALRDKQAHSRLLAVVGQYDLFAAKQKRKADLKAKLANRVKAGGLMAALKRKGSPKVDDTQAAPLEGAEEVTEEEKEEPRVAEEPPSPSDEPASDDNDSEEEKVEEKKEEKEAEEEAAPQEEEEEGEAVPPTFVEKEEEEPAKEKPLSEPSPEPIAPEPEPEPEPVPSEEPAAAEPEKPEAPPEAAVEAEPEAALPPDNEGDALIEDVPVENVEPSGGPGVALPPTNDEPAEKEEDKEEEAPPSAPVPEPLPEPAVSEPDPPEATVAVKEPPALEEEKEELAAAPPVEGVAPPPEEEKAPGEPQVAESEHEEDSAHADESTHHEEDSTHHEAASTHHEEDSTHHEEESTYKEESVEHEESTHADESVEHEEEEEEESTHKGEESTHNEDESTHREEESVESDDEDEGSTSQSNSSVSVAPVKEIAPEKKVPVKMNEQFDDPPSGLSMHKEIHGVNNPAPPTKQPPLGKKTARSSFPVAAKAKPAADLGGPLGGVLSSESDSLDVDDDDDVTHDDDVTSHDHDATQASTLPGGESQDDDDDGQGTLRSGEQQSLSRESNESAADEDSDFTDDDGNGASGGHHHHHHHGEAREMPQPQSSFDPSQSVLKFAQLPSPRVPILNLAEAAHEYMLEKQQDVDAALDALKVRYHALIDKWVDLDGAAVHLDRGALLLASEVNWRLRGRPVSDLVEKFEDIDLAVDESSLRPVSYGIAALRHFDFEVSERLAWARAHPPCKSPTCPNKAHYSEAANGGRGYSTGPGGVHPAKGRGLAVEFGEDGDFELVAAFCEVCTQAGAVLPESGSEDGEGGRNDRSDSSDVIDDPDWMRLDELRSEALERAGLLTEAMHQFSVEAAAALRHTVTKEYEQLRVLLSWKAATVKAKKNTSNASLEQLVVEAEKSGGSSSSGNQGAALAAADKAQGVSKLQERLDLLETQLEVLSEFIDVAGGWRAAVVLGHGFVNVDADVAYWKPDERQAMLTEIVKYLKAQAATEAHRARAAAEKAERERTKLEARLTQLRAELASAKKNRQGPVVSGGGADPAEVLLLKAQLKLEKILSIDLHEKLEDLLEELDEVTGGPPRVRRPAPLLDNNKDALNGGASSRPSTRGDYDDNGNEFKDYPQYQQPFQGRKFGVGGGEDDFFMGAAGAVGALVESDRMRPGSSTSLMRGRSSSGSGGGVGGGDSSTSQRQLASGSGGRTSKSGKGPPSGENATTALLREDGEAVGQDGPVFVDRIRVERAEAKAREAQRELEMAILAEALVSSRQQWRNLQPVYLNQAQKRDPASGLEIVEGLRNEIADRDHRLRCYRRQLQLFGVEDPENPHAPILAEDPRNPGAFGSPGTASAAKDSSTGGGGGAGSPHSARGNGAAASPTTTSVNILKVDHDRTTNDHHENGSVDDDQTQLEPLMMASLASLPPKPRPLSPGAAWEAQASAPPPKAFPGAPTAPLTPFPVNGGAGAGAGNNSIDSNSGGGGGGGGCLEQLEALVKHDKAILGVHNSVLFKRVELGMKRLLVEQRLAKLNASKRKGPGHAGAAWQIGDGSFVVGKKALKSGPGDSDSGDDDDDDIGSVGRGDGGPGKGKLEVALKHYHAQLQRQEERLLTRLNEMRDEHDRIGEECRKRFNRVEVVTQWIFSGMSHRLFLEWARRWKEDLALAEKQRKENGTGSYGGNGSGSGGAMISGDSWRGAGPNLGTALGLVATNQPSRSSRRGDASGQSSSSSRDPLPDVVSLGAGKGSVVRGPDGKRRFLPPPPLEPLAPNAQDAKAALVEDVQAVLRLGPQSYHHHQQASGGVHPGESDANGSLMRSSYGGLFNKSVERTGAAGGGGAPVDASGLGWGPHGDAPTPRGQGHGAAAPLPTQVEMAGTGAVVLPAIPAAAPAAANSASSSFGDGGAGHSQFPWRQSRQQTAALAAAAAQAVAVARANGPGAHPLVRLNGSNNSNLNNSANYYSDPRATPPPPQQQQLERTLMPGQLLQPSLGSSTLNASSAGPAPGASLPRGPSAHVALPHQQAATGGTLRFPRSFRSGGRAGAPPAAHLSAAPGLSAASSAYSSRQR